ncbi:putative senescence regulator S40 [Tanacetum coccineum]
MMMREACSKSISRYYMAHRISKTSREASSMSAMKLLSSDIYDDDDDNEDDWLPPHEYLARVRSASFSVHEGVGRTLKGRDLSRLRNAIWKQTGFEQD